MTAGPRPAWFREAEAIEQVWPFDSVLELVQMRILCRGGVTRQDFDAAVRALEYRRGPDYGTEWGYVRTVMLNRAAERVLDESARQRAEKLAEAGANDGGR